MPRARLPADRRRDPCVMIESSVAAGSLTGTADILHR